MKPSLNFSRVKKPQIEVVFLGKSFLVRERAEVREYANVYSLDSRKVNTLFPRLPFLRSLRAKTNIRAMDPFVALRRRATKQISQF